MTATFGKLEQETLTLEPGLNIILGENEWGKSTWCAFLTAMLYGIDSRAKSTKSVLSDKEHYTPWSGNPMSGRIDLRWNDRDITIERFTRGRQLLGQFRAYETHTGLEIPELTGENCGQQLLGVEKSVFLRSAFIRLQDLPVRDDEALRRRLNNLVTTGDERGGGQQLAAELKELKHKIRYNRSGLLPQLEADRDRLRLEVAEYRELNGNIQSLQRRLDDLEDWRIALENHLTALEFQASEADRQKVQAARQTRDLALQRWEEKAALCASLPDRDTAREVLEEIQRLQDTRAELGERMEQLAEPERPEEALPAFADMDGKEACERAGEDVLRYEKLTRRRFLPPLLGALLILVGLFAGSSYPIPGAVCSGCGVLILLCAWLRKRCNHRTARDLRAGYGDAAPENWPQLAREYAEGLEAFRLQLREYQQRRQKLKTQIRALNETVRETTQEQGLEVCRSDWEQALAAWEACDEAQAEYHRTRAHLDTLESMVKPVNPPEFPDRITYSGEETRTLLAEATQERQRLENLRGQHQGKMSAMGTARELEQALAETEQRIEKLEKTYQALTIAQSTLAEASAELQRRFAPRISSRAQEIMFRLTDGRYDRVRMGEDLLLRAGTGDEITLRDALWRSDGTVDQLYFALRLAVAGELAPRAPLVLDDALVRFDDRRLQRALKVLEEEAESRQVIVFTCHSRERELL